MSNTKLNDDGLREEIFDLYRQYLSDRDFNVIDDGKNYEQLFLGGIEALISRQKQEVERAYGGCHNCYGKGYSTYKTQHTGYGTDGDIGGFEGPYKEHIPVKIIYCKCSRGQQLKVRVKKVEIDSRFAEAARFMNSKLHTNVARLQDLKIRSKSNV